MKVFVRTIPERSTNENNLERWERSAASIGGKKYAKMMALAFRFAHFSTPDRYIMITSNSSLPGFQITHIETCDFATLRSLSNEQVLSLSSKPQAQKEQTEQKEKGDSGGEVNKLARFIQSKMGILHRYQTDEQTNALDLARQAMQRLVAAEPAITQDADFLIYAGISNPLPVATHSALLGSEFGFARPSCWDVKSGCSSGVLALIQALGWLQMGAKRGVIVASETLSKFAHPDILQMSAAVGDGAVAMIVEQSSDWQLRGVVHGTNPEFVTNMLVEGQIPVANQDYEREDFRFSFKDKGNTIETLGEYWVSSLSELLSNANLTGDAITHYMAHQVDGTKNAKIAAACGIPESAVAKNFQHYGNMGAPTVFINYYHWLQRAQQPDFQPGDKLIFHAVGGGLSWAGVCLEKVLE